MASLEWPWSFLGAARWSPPSGSGPWTCVTTLRNTSSMYSSCQLDAGKGLRSLCAWAPTLVSAPSTANGSKPVWNLFYSGCEAGKDKPGDGIVHAVSLTDSIEGPAGSHRRRTCRSRTTGASRPAPGRARLLQSAERYNKRPPA